MPKFKHGTLNGYNYHKCRCPDCVMANRVRVKRYYDENPLQRELKKIYDMTHERSHQAPDRATRALLPDDPRHGTVNAYDNWNCRCVPCKEAVASRNRVRRGGSAPKNPGKYGVVRSTGGGNPDLVAEFDRLFPDAKRYDAQVHEH